MKNITQFDRGLKSNWFIWNIWIGYNILSRYSRSYQCKDGSFEWNSMGIIHYMGRPFFQWCRCFISGPTYGSLLWFIISLLFSCLYHVDNIEGLEIISRPQKKWPFSMRNFAQVWCRPTIRLIYEKNYKLIISSLVPKVTVEHLRENLINTIRKSVFFRMIHPTHTTTCHFWRYSSNTFLPNIN